jgi:hypothetical protein
MRRKNKENGEQKPTMLDSGYTPRRRGSSTSLCIVLLATLCLPGCASLFSSATNRLATNISNAILNQDDPKTVQDGAPAYLLMIDGLIDGDPENEILLRAGAKLYGSYAGVFVDDPERARRLTDKAWGFARRALCVRRVSGCVMHTRPYQEFIVELPTMNTQDMGSLYTYANAWAGWIQTHQSDFNAIADIPKVRATLERVVELDDSYDNGGPHLYLGILSTLIPPILGGKPEEARTHFERAIALSKDRNLMVKVTFAERYARLLFDRPMHDRILKEVLAAEPREPGLTLMNVLAQKRARELLDTANSYF